MEGFSYPDGEKQAISDPYQDKFEKQINSSLMNMIRYKASADIDSSQDKTSNPKSTKIYNHEICKERLKRLEECTEKKRDP